MEIKVVAPNGSTKTYKINIAIEDIEAILKDKVLVYYNNDIKVEDIFLKENGEDWVQSQTFTLTNNYIKTITYDIGVLVSENTFSSENFEYEVYKVNNGVKTKVGSGLVRDLTAGNTGTGHIIAGKGAGNALVLDKDSSATFEIVYRLKNLSEEQPDDMGKVFNAKLNITFDIVG